MKITESALRQIIAEEYQKLMEEGRMSGKAYLQARGRQEWGLPAKKRYGASQDDKDFAKSMTRQNAPGSDEGEKDDKK